MEFFLISLLNGVSYGLLLFMLSAGLTLIFSMMGVLNFAHASFYMLGAYWGFTLSALWGFVPALILAPLGVGLLGAGFEKWFLRRVHAHGHVPELLITFGLAYVVLEVVQLLWGRSAVPFAPPAWLQGPAFTLIGGGPFTDLHWVWGAASEAACQGTALCSPFPATRAFMMGVALVMVISLWALITHTRVGLVIQAALTHPQAVQTLGHNVPRVFMLVFGVGTGLAALAGVIGGSTFVTEPSMAATVGSVTFVVIVVGGLGSLAGAFGASLLIGTVQTMAVAIDLSLSDLWLALGLPGQASAATSPWMKLTLSQAAPILPYLFLVLMLMVRPRGLMGTREG
jgi:branched-chain amino acid transport system permease protein